MEGDNRRRRSTEGLESPRLESKLEPKIEQRSLSNDHQISKRWKTRLGTGKAHQTQGPLSDVAAETRILCAAIFGQSRINNLCDALDIECYGRYLQATVSALARPFFAPALLVLKQPPIESLLPSLKFLKDVATAYGSKSSVDDVVKKLSISAGIANIQKDNQEARSTIRKAVFAALGIITMIYQPTREPIGDEVGIVLRANTRFSSLERKLNMDRDCPRPLSGLCIGLGCTLPKLDLSLLNLEESPTPSSLIYASSLRFNILKNIGKVSVAWTNVLNAHMIFNPISRTLFLFRLPSFCAISCIREKEGNDLTIPDILLHELFDRQTEKTERAMELERDEAILYGTQAFKQEVLLSYRVIFGQNEASRKLFRNEERSAAGQTQPVDPLLDLLCGHVLKRKRQDLPTDLWPLSCRDPQGHLQEQDVYSTTTDFPTLGPRLLRLQAYSLRQTPSKIRDLWRDFRTPLQWYTFWAVVLFGGLGVCLGTLQTLLAIAQVVSVYEN